MLTCVNIAAGVAELADALDSKTVQAVSAPFHSQPRNIMQQTARQRTSPVFAWDFLTSEYGQEELVPSNTAQRNAAQRKPN
jgi:hypothetical protein